MNDRRMTDMARHHNLGHVELWLALIFVLAFGGISYGVHHLYPFFAFDMFTRPDSTHSERLAARGADGKLREVKAFAQWNCPAMPKVGLVDLPTDGPKKCAVRDTMDSQERRALGWIRQHSASTPRPQAVEVVRRVWRMPTTTDPGEVYVCPLLNCTAELVGAAP